jgi:hypothetical protein
VTGGEKAGPGEAPERRPADGEPQFYYSRERRLSKAPASVRALYEDQGRPRFNLLRPLVSTRSNAVLFGTLVVLAFISLAMGFSAFGAGAQDYRGCRISVSALRFEGAALVTIKKTVRGEGYAGPLDIAVSPVSGGESPTYPHRVIFSPGKSEEFRFSVPFEGPELLVRISPETGEGDGLAFRVKTK